MNQASEPSKATKNSTVSFSDELLKGSVAKNIIRLGLPIMAMNLIENAYYIVDMIFVGKLGPSALAAVSMGGVLVSLTWTLLVGVMIATSSFVARYFGAEDEKMVNRVVIQTLILVGIISLFLLVFGLFGVGPTLRLLGAEGEVLSLGKAYTTLIFCFAFNHILLYVINAIFRGSGDTKTPMMTLGISAVINIVLDPLLIFGLGPFPEMGVQGAAVATIIGQAVGAGLNLFILTKGLSRIRLQKVAFGFDKDVFISLVRVAIPGSIQNLMTTVSGLAIMRMVTPFGTAAVAAYGIGIRLDITVMLPGWAMGAAVATIVGQNLGAGQPKRAEKTGWTGCLMYLMILVVLVGIMQLVATPLVGIFNNETDVLLIGTDYIRIVSIGYLFLSFMLIPAMSMNGAGYAVVPMVINLVTLICLRIPLAIAASNFLGNSINGIFWAITISMVVHALLSTIWFKKGNWKNKVIHR